MGKKSPKAPSAPDPAATAAAQSATNKETAYWNAVLNNVNQTTPYGSITYTQSGDGKYDPSKPPQFSSSIQLSPEQQALYDTNMKSENALATLGNEQLGRISSAVSTPFSFGGIGNEINTGDIAAQSQAGQDAIMARLNPQFQRDEEALRARLINQGIGQGSQAYQREMEGFGQKQNDARTQAILAGQQYGTTAQNNQLALRNQGIQEYTTQRNAPLNEYTAMTSGNQITNPQFTSGNYQGAAAPDYANLVNQNYQNQMAQYNAKVAGKNATTSGLFGLGGSFLGAAGSAGGIGNLLSMAAPAIASSDRKLKENITPAGKENGHNIYEFNYIGKPERYIGVMAQEVQETNPEAVHEVDGYLAVDYNAIGVKMREVANV
jgi:hypothetical protein